MDTALQPKASHPHAEVGYPKEQPVQKYVPKDSQDFLTGLLCGGPSCIVSVDGEEGCAGLTNRWSLAAEEKEQLASSISSEEIIDENAGTDVAARVLAFFCRRHGGDARTLRTIIDVLQCLRPPLEPVELFMGLSAIAARFAPVALMLEAGRALVNLCCLFDQLLLFHDPEVALLLNRAKLGAEIYCAPWLLTAHAAGLANPEAALSIWEGWLASGEALDPIFLGLARLQLCHDELLLCGPVPELAQLLQKSLCGAADADPGMVVAALQKAAELKECTPLSFLRQLQHALLKPPPKVAETTSSSPETQATPAAQSTQAAKTGGAAAIAQRATSWLQSAQHGIAAAASRHHANTNPAAGQTNQNRVVSGLVCMRVEPQDVMMMETVKSRHLRKTHSSAEHADQIDPRPDDPQPDPKSNDRPATAEDLSAATAKDAPAIAERQQASASKKDFGCRLLPKLIDVRSPAEVRSSGVKGAKAVNISEADSVNTFLAWAHERQIKAAAFGLSPMHVLLTSSGVMNQEQVRFIRSVLVKGVPMLCILAGGYESLLPFFNEPAEGNRDQPKLLEKAQDAKQLLQKGLGNVKALWDKAPTRQQVVRNVAEGRPAAGVKAGLGNLLRRGKGGEEDKAGMQDMLFDRAPLFEDEGV